VPALPSQSARNRWRAPDDQRVAAALRDQGLDATDDETSAALALVEAFLDSPLREEIGDSRVSAEVPFVLRVRDTMIRGSIDLLVEGPDGSVLVVDYKTNHLEGRDPREIAEGRYSVQRDLYALAAAARGEPVETAYVFLERPDQPVRTRFSVAELEPARAGIESLLDRLAAGRFEVTRHPHRDLCLDCPARERLCSHQSAAHMRDHPQPAIEPAGREAESEEAHPKAAANADPQLSLLEGG
jgi:ATP-dependent helicase/nuclease subunit A